MAQSSGFSVEEEMKKNPDLKETDILALREWCKTQPHLPEISDRELVLFLHSNYYQVEQTKRTIESYYSIRTHTPEFFASRDPVNSKELRRMFDTVCIVPLEQKTKEGYSVMFAKMVISDPSNYNYDDHVKYVCMCLDIWLLEEGTMYGNVIIVDTSGSTLGHATRFKPGSAKKFMKYQIEGLPIRLKAMHMINMNPIVETMVNLVKPIMKKEIIDLIHYHSSMETLENFIPIEMLPNDLGGKAGALEDLHKAQIKKLENYRDWFLDDEKSSRVDESKRPEPAGRSDKSSSWWTFGFK